MPASTAKSCVLCMVNIIVSKNAEKFVNFLTYQCFL